MFSSIKKYRELGVLGLNKRNADYIASYNRRRLYPLADDKVRTKKLASSAGIAVPELYCVINSLKEFYRVIPEMELRSSLVIKPSHGSGGEGVLVITEVSENKFIKVDGEILSLDYVEHYISNVLSGLYSLGAHPDCAMVEKRVEFDPVFENISYQGVPDIRIIVFQGIPVMAMLRLPTKASHGRANLHQGAIGVGVTLSNGKTLKGVSKNEVIEKHPDTGFPISDLIIPHWDHLLNIAARCYELTGLGYLGVDMVLDLHEGPLVLEVNARPGLNIQIANGVGLLNRLKLVEKNISKLRTVEERVSFAKENFQVHQENDLS